MAESKTKLKDPESEKTIVAGMLTNKERIDKVLLNSSSKYFSNQLHRNLFSIITKVFIKHTCLVTNELISNYMEGVGIKQEVRLKYLRELDELRKKEVNEAEFAFALGSLRKAYVAKSVAEILHKVTDILDKKGGLQAFNTLDKKLYDLKLNTIDSDYMSLTDIRNVDDLVAHLKDIREHPEKFKGIKCGWEALDRLTAGFQPQEYIMIIAKSGSGKSMAMLNWANRAQKDGYNVVYVSLEMPEKVIRMRQLALESKIPFINIKTQNLSVEQLNKQDMVLRNEIANREGAFYIMDVPKCGVGLIEAQLRQLNQKMPIDIVFIDYLGLLRPEAHIRSSSKWEVASAISEELRDLARTMKITVVSANQITTDGMKKRAEDDLEIEDIAISRRIIDPIDIVVGLIWDKNNPNEMRMSIPKCRGGRIQSAKLFCDLDICTIADFDESDSFVETAPDVENLGSETEPL